MRGDRGARGLAVTGHDIDHAIRNSRIPENALELEGAERCLFRGLEQTAAARRERGSKLHHRTIERSVPRNDQPDDAVRLHERIRMIFRKYARDAAVRHDIDGLTMD